MKKFLSIVAVAGLLSVNAMANEGKVSLIIVKSGGAVYAEVTSEGTDPDIQNRALVGTSDAKKAMLAVLLTAKSTNSTVSAQNGSYDGTAGWKIIRLK